MARAVTFDASCVYDSAPYNSQDVNKLFGLSFGFGGVHHNSARFGWRYSMADKCIELLAYCYIEGQRNWDEQMRFPVVAQVQPGQKVHCRLGLHTQGMFFFTVRDEAEKVLGMELSVKAPALPHFGLTHGLYFGGSMAAPHTMAVQIDRL
jgi:hypothetical protein